MQYQINIALGTSCGFLFILVIYLLAKLSSIKKRISNFLPEKDNINLEEMLVEYINRVNQVLETEDNILKTIETNNHNTFQTLDTNSKDLNNKLDSAIYNLTSKIDTLDKDINYKVDTLNQEINNKVDNIHDETTNALQNANHRIDLTNIKMENSVQKYSLVRYNPFDDVGGDFCYSIAFLDAHNSGFVLTSIYSREGGYAYAKEIINGNSTQKLSPEEESCLGQAMSIQVETV